MEYTTLLVWSVPIRFAAMFVLIFMAHREYTSLNLTIKTMSWKHLFITTLSLALYTYIAGALLYEALLEIKAL